MTGEIIRIYKSLKVADLYLYTLKNQSLDQLPKALIESLGKTSVVMDLLISEQTRLARASAHQVLSSIRDKGFYLQMPPPKDDYMLDLSELLNDETLDHE